MKGIPRQLSVLFNAFLGCFAKEVSLFSPRLGGALCVLGKSGRSQINCASSATD